MWGGGGRGSDIGDKNRLNNNYLWWFKLINWYICKGRERKDDPKLLFEIIFFLAILTENRRKNGWI